MDSPLTLVRRLRAEPRRRDAVDAAVTAVVGLLLIWVGVVELGGSPWGVPSWAQSPWWHAGPLLLGCLALLMKRGRPLLTVAIVVPLTALDVAFGASVGMYVVLLDALYCLVLHGRRHWVRPVIGTIAVLVVGGTVAMFVITGDVQLAALVFLQTFALLGTPVWWGLSVRQHAELAALASARAEDLQRLAELRRERAVRDERARMAQDLHDALSSHLSTIAIHSQLVSGDATASDVTAREATAGAAASISEIRAASVRALEDLREMILLLRTGEDQIMPAAGLADLDALVATARGTGLTVQVDAPTNALPDLPSVVHQTAYRIVQEALANAAKHAPGAQVLVVVAVREDTLLLQVSSRAASGEGPRRDPAAAGGSGLGLATMRDRVATLGGDFVAGPGEDGSWVVRAELPLTEVLIG